MTGVTASNVTRTFTGIKCLVLYVEQLLKAYSNNSVIVVTEQICPLAGHMECALRHLTDNVCDRSAALVSAVRQTLLSKDYRHHGHGKSLKSIGAINPHQGVQPVLIRKNQPLGQVHCSGRNPERLGPQSQ